MKALLFDLDGTLTRSGGGGTRALGQALHARPQAVAELRKMRLDGMTDRGIARIVLAAGGGQALPIEERMRGVAESEIDAVLERYVEALAAECGARAYEAQPGVPELLLRLRRRSDVLLGLCTGNLARGAELKLTSAGLWGDFRFGGDRGGAGARPPTLRAPRARGGEPRAAGGAGVGGTPPARVAAPGAGLPPPRRGARRF